MQPQALDLGCKVRVFIDRYGDIPYVKAVGVDVVERLFLLLLDSFLEAPNILVATNFDRKYASRIFAEDTTIQQEQGRCWSTDYCK
jgi:hypothetical protein